MDMLFSLLQKGGFAVYVLLFLSLVSWALIIERLVNLRSGSILSKSVKDVRSLLAGGDIEGALKLLSLDNSPAGGILYRMLEEYKSGKVDRRTLLTDLSFEVSLLVPKVEKKPRPTFHHSERITSHRSIRNDNGFDKGLFSLCSSSD